ncbi:hypothetical protein LUZ60_000847 [Juncus effusus]|nr:hypothetical protein LUZ60_000847 [Juncus effusus]
MSHRILLFPLPYQGHINPMMELGSVLHSLGFSITVFHTQFNSIDPTKYPLYDFILVEEKNDVCSDSFNVDDLPGQIMRMNDRYEESFCAGFMRVTAESKEPVPCLIVDMNWYKMQDVGKRLGVATLVLRTGNAASTSWYVAYPLLVEKGYFPVQESRRYEPLKELPPLRLKDIIQLGKSSVNDVSTFLSRDIEALRNSSGLIINTFDAIESSELERVRQELSIPVFPIGPLHKITPKPENNSQTQDRSCLDWLDTHSPNSVLYVSFGSLAAMNHEDFVETAWGLANSKQPFLWVIRAGLISGADRISLPDGFEEAIRDRARIVSWAPQKEVLAHVAVGGFWTHAGWNSTLEALCEGVPMICKPYFADQMGNTRYITYVWKVGIELEGKLERESIEKEIRRLMEQREGDEMRERMKVIGDEASACIKKDGSSYVAINKLVDLIMSF